MKPKTRRIIVVLICIGFLMVGALTAKRDLIFNATPSKPLGFYRLKKKDVFEQGDLVMFSVPAGIEELVRTRNYIPPKGHLMKNIIGGAGDTYCIHDQKFYVGDKLIGPIFATDSKNRPLPQHAAGCHKVPPEYMLIGIAEIERSFDSRYFGPVPTNTILGIAEPLWTW